MAASVYKTDNNDKHSKTWESLYDLSINTGAFAGTFNEWLEWIRKGEDGKDAFELSGFTGTLSQWLISLRGTDGTSAYRESGYLGTEKQWIQSLIQDLIAIHTSEEKIYIAAELDIQNTVVLFENNLL